MRRSRKGAGETPRYRCRSFGAILLLLFLLPLWGGCRGEGRGRNPKEIVVGLEATPGTLDPRFIVDAHADRIEKIVYDGLVRRDPKGAFIPGLAERWEAISPTRYRFHLRRGVHFHDGTPFSAADVKATYESILDPRTQSPRISAFEKIEHIEVIDPHTVEIVLEEPFAPILTSLVVGIMPAHATKGKGGPPIGTGPFIFEGEARGQWLRFRANRDYWGGSPAIERVTFKIIPDDAARILELEKGRIDLLQNNVPPENLDLIRKNGRYRIMIEPGVNYSYLGFNLRDPILAKREVRAAIAYAIDRERIARHLLQGQVTLATGMLAPSNWAYEGDVETYPYDPKRARALLDAAGFPDPPGDAPRFRLSYKTSTNKERRAIAEVIREALGAVGIEIDLRAYEFGTLFEDIRKGNFQLYSLTWTGITEPDIFYSVFHSRSTPPEGANRGHYVNPRIDELTEKGRVTLDPAERKRIYSEVQKIVAHDLPYVSLWYANNIVVIRRDLVGFAIYPGGDYTALEDLEIRPVGGEE